MQRFQEFHLFVYFECFVFLLLKLLIYFHQNLDKMTLAEKQEEIKRLKKIQAEKIEDTKYITE